MIVVRAETIRGVRRGLSELADEALALMAMLPHEGTPSEDATLAQIRAQLRAAKERIDVWCNELAYSGEQHDD